MLINGSNKESSLSCLFYQALFVLALSFALTFILSNQWNDYQNVIHTIVEFIVIFIALSSFMVVWFSYERNQAINHILGFGFLIFAVFEMLHAFFYPGLNLYPQGCQDIAVRFWILGGFTEALMFLICTSVKPERSIDKKAGLFISLALAAGLIYLMFVFYDLLPSFQGNQGLSSIKTWAEIIIMILFLASLYNIGKTKKTKAFVNYRYIFLALILVIITEASFLFYNNNITFSMTYGHVLKIFYFYYIFKGIFVTAVAYPYEKIEELSKNTANILDELPLGLITYDHDNRLTFVNKRVSEFTDYPGNQREICYGLTAEEILKRVNMSCASVQIIMDCLKTNKKAVKDQIISYTNAKGGEVKLTVEAQKLNNNGTLLLVGLAKRKQELENLQLQTQTILNSINNPVLVTDIDNKIIMCNKALETEHGLCSNELIGMTIEQLNRLTDFSWSGEKPSLGQQKLNVKAGYEATYTNMRGEVKDVILYPAHIYNIDGECIGKICTNYDLAAMKKEQQKIQQKEKLALLGEMAAGIVHEIKNPLTTIKGFTQLILNKAESEEITKYAEIIKNESEGVNKVVSDFLTFAKPCPPVFNELSVNSFIKSVIVMVESHAYQRNINIFSHLATKDIFVQGDKIQLKQVLLNITKNAIEAVTGVQNPTVSISTGLIKNTDEVYISVTDNGVGISYEDAVKVGTPFFTNKDQGTGLGLSISYQIVKEHGGRIEFNSKLGRGTCFTVFLPGKAGQAGCQGQTAIG